MRKLTEKRSPSERERAEIEFSILYSIAKEICPNVWKQKEAYHTTPSSIQGTIIVEIRMLKRQIANQKRIIKKLDAKIQAMSQMSLFDLGPFTKIVEERDR